MASSPRFREYWNAREISAFSRYFDKVIVWPRPYADGSQLTSLVEAKTRRELTHADELEDLSQEKDKCTLLMMNGTFNFHLDIQDLLQSIRPKLHRSSRLLVVAYNPYLHWAYVLATWIGLREGELPVTYVTRTDVENLAALSGFRVTKLRPTCHCPWRLFGLGIVLNRLLGAIPVIRWMGFTSLIMLRPLGQSPELPTLSVVIPARNEKGNIENSILRMPALGPGPVEIVFVEGHSTDGTWAEIQRLQRVHASRPIRALQQSGQGKCDAVRLGLAHCTGELVAILDADLTMPPELLPRFYNAYVEGQGDFINGSRLVYPMEGSAMRFLNRIGNGFFAKALSFVLDTRLSDSLCGTKLFARRDYRRMMDWRDRFGEFDPFGDFELLFPAAVLGLGVVDVPVRYRARTYGHTSIHRFRDGWVLLKMTLIGFLRIRMGEV